MGDKGRLLVTYNLEDCLGSSGFVCVSAVTVSYKNGEDTEYVDINKHREIVFNGEAVSDVRVALFDYYLSIKYSFIFIY